LKILVHDYTGHPFQVQLSRSLAARGYRIRHVYSASFQTPRGALARRADDPDTFEIGGIRLKEEIAKYSFIKRRGQEREYGRLLAEEVDRFDPDVVISSNTPPDAQAILQKRCLDRNRKFVFWLQDVFSVAIERVLRPRLPVLWWPIAAHYRRLERTMLARSDRIVLITDDFRSAIDWRRTPREAIHVIENWAPLEEMPVRPKDNPWAREHGLADKFCFIYSGTLGLKHNPDLLLQVALRMREDPRVRVVVVSEGLGADWLKEKKDELGLENLMILGFQPFEVLPDVLGSADVLTAILEPDAGVFSVPSKVLTYLCAGRALLLAVPEENLAARIVSRNDAGVVVDPLDTEGFVGAAVALLDDSAKRERYAGNARAYAERTFDIEAITDKFVKVLTF
jgi:glycosyltransferase involved in cell wall biosynthesis